MKRSSFILTSGIWLLTFGFSPAILDTNNNGLSDFWEREYSAGELFPANFDPQADYDADGWTNDREAAAGTDPHDPNPPDGIIRPATEHVPAVISEVNGVPVVVSPESIKVTWPTLAGKQYTLLYSPDLTQGSWLTVGDPFIAIGGVSEYIFYEVSATDKCFWRVAVTDVDTDGDGLNDHEEHVFGTNPNLPMTFGNIPDFWLAQNFPSIEGFNPNGDPDGDGINNDQENQLGLDPNHFDKIGPVNFGFDEGISESPDLSFRTAMFPYPSDLYDQTSIPGYNADSSEFTEGWQADTGSHIEIWDESIAVSPAQQQPEGGAQATAPATASRYVELQSHMEAHGVKQEFNMLPGTRLNFIRCYKGRYAYDAYDNEFDLKVEGASELLVDGSPVSETGTTRSKSFMNDDDWDKYIDWHYATVSITAESGSSGLKKITLSFVPKTTTTSGYNGEEGITYGGFVDLLPLEIKAHQNNVGPYGSPTKYNESPSLGSVSNLLSVWANEEIILKIKLPAPFDQQENLPPNLIKWNVPDHNFPDNTLEASMNWNSNPLNIMGDTKLVVINIGGNDFEVRIRIENVGILPEAVAGALRPIASSVMLARINEARSYVASFPDGPKKDAIRHSYWCSLSVSTFSVTATDVSVISTAHEYDNRSGGQQAYNGTMDLYNNSVGITINRQVNGLPDNGAIKQNLEQLYTAGEMYVWEVPLKADSESAEDSEGILIKSNGNRIYQ